MDRQRPRQWLRYDTTRGLCGEHGSRVARKRIECKRDPLPMWCFAVSVAPVALRRRLGADPLSTRSKASGHGVSASATTTRSSSAFRCSSYVWRSPPLGHGHRRRRRRSPFGPYLYRSAFESSTPSEECQRALAHLQHVIELEGPSTIAALVLESVIGGSGVIPPPPGYLEGVRELCTEHGIVYIADEIMVLRPSARCG